MRYHFTNFYYSFPIAKESARVNGAISSVFLGVCRTKRLSNAQTTHFFTRSWEPSKNSYLTILIYMTQKKEKKVGKRQVYIVAKFLVMKSWGGHFLWKRIWDLDWFAPVSSWISSSFEKHLCQFKFVIFWDWHKYVW